jgi:hypothetical protein
MKSKHNFLCPIFFHFHLDYGVQSYLKPKLYPQGVEEKGLMMGEAVKRTFTLQHATVDDLPDMAAIILRALSWNPISKVFDEILPYEAQLKVQMQRDVGRVTVGHELGATRTFKVVDESG